VGRYTRQNLDKAPRMVTMCFFKLVRPRPTLDPTLEPEGLAPNIQKNPTLD